MESLRPCDHCERFFLSSYLQYFIEHVGCVINGIRELYKTDFGKEMELCHISLKGYAVNSWYISRLQHVSEALLPI
jgi:hypothetical protein